MAVRVRADKEVKKRREDDEFGMKLARVVEHFNSQDTRIRLEAIDAWAQAATDNPGSQSLLDSLPKVIRHLSDTNTQVLGAALDAWKAAAKANPGKQEVLAYMPAIMERLDDPDELVRYAARSAVEAAAKANPGDPALDEAKARAEAGKKK